METTPVCDESCTNENAKGQGGQILAEARKRVGLTQARLSALADCSIASIAWIEQGAVPQHSAVLERAWQVIDALNESAPAATAKHIPPTKSGGSATNATAAKERGGNPRHARIYNNV